MKIRDITIGVVFFALMGICIAEWWAGCGDGYIDAAERLEQQLY